MTTLVATACQMEHYPRLQLEVRSACILHLAQQRLSAAKKSILLGAFGGCV
jgi:hypothetical protein